MTAWWQDDRVVLERMLAWRGEGPPPNYLQLAWHRASPSLRAVVASLGDSVADNLVMNAFTTSGARMTLRCDVFLAWAEENYPRNE